MVKFGGVRNYLVGIWEPSDLDACADLNLPCADVSAYLPERLDHASSGEFGTHDYFVSWGAGLWDAYARCCLGEGRLPFLLTPPAPVLCSLHPLRCVVLRR